MQILCICQFPQLSNKQILFNTFKDSFPLLMSNSTLTNQTSSVANIVKEIFVFLQKYRKET